MSAYYSHSNYSLYSYNIWWSLSSLHRQSYSPASYFSLTLPSRYFFSFVNRKDLFCDPSFCTKKTKKKRRKLDRVLFIQLFNRINFCISFAFLIKHLMKKYYYSSRFSNAHTHRNQSLVDVNRGSRTLIQVGDSL